MKWIVSAYVLTILASASASAAELGADAFEALPAHVFHHS